MNYCWTTEYRIDISNFAGQFRKWVSLHIVLVCILLVIIFLRKWLLWWGFPFHIWWRLGSHVFAPVISHVPTPAVSHIAVNIKACSRVVDDMVGWIWKCTPRASYWEQSSRINADKVIKYNDPCESPVKGKSLQWNDMSITTCVSNHQQLNCLFKSLPKPNHVFNGFPWQRASTTESVTMLWYSGWRRPFTQAFNLRVTFEWPEKWSGRPVVSHTQEVLFLCNCCSTTLNCAFLERPKLLYWHNRSRNGGRVYRHNHSQGGSRVAVVAE